MWDGEGPIFLLTFTGSESMFVYLDIKRLIKKYSCVKSLDLPHSSNHNLLTENCFQVITDLN